MAFVHLNCHSYYSFLDGTASIGDLIAGAKELNMDTLALTDTNGIYGAVEFYKEATKSGVKPVFGVVIKTAEGRALMIALNREGYAQISGIVTRQNLEEDFSLEAELTGPGGTINGNGFAVLLDDPRLLRIATSAGCKNLYAEIVRDGRPLKLERQLIRTARSLKVPLVATNNIHFIKQGDYQVHRCLRAIAKRTTLSRLGDGDAARMKCSFKSGEEMIRLFGDLPEAVENAVKLARRCNVEFELGKPVFPEFPIPKGETHYSYLCKICFDAAAGIYKPLTREVIKRLSYELEVIDRLGFSPYFLIVWDIVRFACEQRIPVVGRGSAGDSLVSYVLGITPVDPIKYNLYFQRFLNLERSDPPDIDIDFCWRRRGKVIKYVYEKYGYDRVAMIGTYYRFSFRSAIRELARVMGVPEEKISEFTRRLPYFSVRSVQEAVELIPECRNLPLDEEPYCRLLPMAERIQDFPRHLSTHPGGIVIAPRPLTWYLSLQRGGNGLAVTQMDMHSTEEIGLVKIDLLGQRGLSVVQDTVEAVKENYGIDIDFTRLDPTRDFPTCRMISQGETMGCFYIESPAMRLLEKKLNVINYDLLVAASSIIRPGVANSGMMDRFIRCHTGKEKVSYLHLLMEKLLGDTYGIMIYQEDVIKVAHHLAGFSFSEADLLRRGMSKKRHWTDLNEYRQRFIEGAISRGIEREIAEQIWKQIDSFSGYSFCKAHSASYAVISFRSAYLRNRFPAEFMASVLSNSGGFYSTSAYLEEARRMGLKIVPPSINLSEEAYTGKNGELTVGLMQIKGLSRATIKSIIEERRAKGPFKTLEDVLLRTGMSLTDAEILIKVGTMDEFGHTRPGLLWKLREVYDSIEKIRGRIEEAAETIFDECGGLTTIPVPDLKDYHWKEKLRLEMELLGMAVSAHPMRMVREEVDSIRHVNASDLSRHAGRRVTVVGRIVTAKRTVTHKGEFMKFITLEDETGLVEVVLFPGAYRSYGHLLVCRGPFVVTGKVENDSGGITLTAAHIKLVELRKRERGAGKVGTISA